MRKYPGSVPAPYLALTKVAGCWGVVNLGLRCVQLGSASRNWEHGAPLFSTRALAGPLLTALRDLTPP